MPASLKKRKLMAEINVVPYIDVMLVLLIIFMVTAPLLTQGIEVELSVDAEGNLYINAGDDEDKPSSGRKIVTIVSVVLGEKPETPVFVKADRAVQYGNVVGAMVLLQQAGANNIGFVTDPLDSYPIPE